MQQIKPLWSRYIRERTACGMTWNDCDHFIDFNEGWIRKVAGDHWIVTTQLVPPLVSKCLACRSCCQPEPGDGAKKNIKNWGPWRVSPLLSLLGFDSFPSLSPRVHILLLRLRCGASSFSPIRLLPKPFGGKSPSADPCGSLLRMFCGIPLQISIRMNHPESKQISPREIPTDAGKVSSIEDWLQMDMHARLRTCATTMFVNPRKQRAAPKISSPCHVYHLLQLGIQTIYFFKRSIWSSTDQKQSQKPQNAKSSLPAWAFVIDGRHLAEHLWSQEWPHCVFLGTNP